MEALWLSDSLARVRESKEATATKGCSGPQVAGSFKKSLKLTGVPILSTAADQPSTSQGSGQLLEVFRALEDPTGVRDFERPIRT